MTDDSYGLWGPVIIDTLVFAVRFVARPNPRIGPPVKVG